MRKNDVMQIEAELDGLEVEELYDVYTKMLELFNYICNNVTLLQPIAIPNRTIIYDAQIESSPDAENYYTRVRDKDCVKNRVKRAKIVRFTLC